MDVAETVVVEKEVAETAVVEKDVAVTVVVETGEEEKAAAVLVEVDPVVVEKAGGRREGLQE